VNHGAAPAGGVPALNSMFRLYVSVPACAEPAAVRVAREAAPSNQAVVESFIALDSFSVYPPPVAALAGSNCAELSRIQANEEIRSESSSTSARRIAPVKIFDHIPGNTIPS